MKLSMTRRGFVLGSASAAVLAGLAGRSMPGVFGDAKKESVVPQDFSSIKNEVYKSDYAYTLMARSSLRKLRTSCLGASFTRASCFFATRVRPCLSFPKTAR